MEIKKYTYDVSINIVNYNTKEIVINTIDSLIHYTEGVLYEILIIDNASTDDSYEYLTNRYKGYPNIKVILSDKNLGFANASNITLSKSQGKYIYLINPDAYVNNNVLKYYLDFSEKNKDLNIGSLGSQMYDDNGDQINSNGIYYYSLQIILLRFRDILLFPLIPNKLLSKLKNNRTKRRSNNEIIKYPKQVQYVLGANLFIPSDVLKDIGLFDPDYFMYSEESDLQFRMMKKGYNSFLIDGPKVVHESGGSFTSKTSNTRRLMLSIGRLIFVRKHYRKMYYFLFKSSFLFTIILELIVDLIRRKYTLSENLKFFKLYYNESYK